MTGSERKIGPDEWTEEELMKRIPPVHDYTPAGIRAIREREQGSRAQFAAALGGSASAVGRWERGDAKSSPPAMKLLDIVDRKGLDFIR